MTNKPAQSLAWLTLGAIVFITVCPIGLRPSDVFPVDVDRALASGLLAAIFVIAYPRHWLRIGVAMVVCAGGIELLQLLSATRHARFEDAAVKAAGAVLGVTLALAVNAMRSRHMMSHVLRRLANRRHMTVLPMQEVPEASPVASRMIEAVYFSKEDGRLQLRFRNGEERVFAGVAEADAAALVSAPSPGQYYLDHIRTRYRRLAA